MATPLRPLRDESPEAAALELFASGDPPAFATDSWHRITFWNSGAERLLKRSAEDAIGRACYEVLQGRDIFGNRFCYEKCPLFVTVRRGEPARSFDLMTAAVGEHEQALSVTTVQVSGRRPDLFTLIHILRRADDHRRIARLLDRLVPPEPPAEPAADPAARPPIEEPPLTPREREVLRAVAAGLQNKEIAQRLDISLATVRNHIHNILEKLHVHSKLEASSLAYRRGWVRPGS